MSKKLIIGLSLLVVVLAVSFLYAAATKAPGAAKTYQVTGPVLAVTDTAITVQKGTEKWELERNADTKVTGDLKVGDKVTIIYRMIATSVEVKPETKGAAPKKKP